MSVIPVDPYMLQRYYGRFMDEHRNERRRRLDSIKSKADALAYIADARGRIVKTFGAFPTRTELNPRITEISVHEGVRIERVIFESRPGFFVTALLYIPDSGQGKHPGVLALCGHAGDGKNCEPYRRYAFMLSRKGFAVIMPDPVSQGERLQFKGIPGGERYAACTHEHNQMGKQLHLLGEFFGTWRVWDAVRALDYLCTRSEVDTTRLSVTGNSGGGTLTSYVFALDDRLKAAAPSCFITTYSRNFENELFADSEQIPPGIIANGCDMADFMIARAPHPVIMLGQKNDFFDHRGTLESYGEAKKIYDILGAGENIKYFIGPQGHGYSVHNREAMYEFFIKHNGLSSDFSESREPAEQSPCLCTKSGCVSEIPGSVSLPRIIAERASKLAASRPKLSTEALKSKIKTALRLEIPSVTPDYTMQHQESFRKLADGRFVSLYGVKSEPGITAHLHLLDDTGYFHLPPGRKAVLHVSHLDSEDDLKLFEISPERRVFALDVRGIGKTLTLTCGQKPEDFFDVYGADYFYDSTGKMLNRPYLGGKVLDVISSLMVLRDAGYDDVSLSGRGLGAICAAFAAVLAPDLYSDVTLVNAPISWTQMAKRFVFRWPQSHFVSGMLNDYDLPDIYRALEPGKIRLVSPWDDFFHKYEHDSLESEMTEACLPLSLACK